ncbi:hypothetical protein FGB62_13g135 [Gracilaria domingensis]|nr:hypothetical protein FGB62_13g135 [Gracilaria domingensis]
MLQFLSSLKTEYAPYPAHPQTIIVGTNDARKIFCDDMDGVLLTRENALVCDLHILNSLRRQPDWRYVAIVSSASELYTIAEKVRTVSKIHSVNFVVIGVQCDLAQGVSLRTAALKELDAVGVILVVESDGRGQKVFQDVLRVWREHKEDESMLSAWGEPSLVSTKDVIIPPRWDSEGKIRAVVDAAGENYEAISEASSWGTEIEAPKVDMQTEQSKMEQQELGKLKKEEHLRKFEAWTTRMRLLSEKVQQNPGNDVTEVDKAETSDSTPAQADFFQKLLAGTR